MNLPENVIKFINENDYKYSKILQYNDRKGTFVVKLSKNNKFYVLKGYFENIFMDIKQRFVLEVDFLKQFSKCDIFPNLIMIGDNFLLMDFIDGMVLREYFLKNKNTDDLMYLFESINKFYLCLKNYNNNIKLENLNLENIYRYLYVLTLSTPFQLKFIKFSLKEKFRNKLIYLFLKWKLKYLVKKNKHLNIKYIKFSHNDLHYNNIIMDKNIVKFIDFENIQFEGSFDIDIIFLLVLIERLEVNNVKLEEYICSFVSKNIFYNEVYKVFKTAIKYNKRFYIPKEVENV